MGFLVHKWFLTCFTSWVVLIKHFCLISVARLIYRYFQFIMFENITSTRCYPYWVNSLNSLSGSFKANAEFTRKSKRTSNSAVHHKQPISGYDLFRCCGVLYGNFADACMPHSASGHICVSKLTIIGSDNGLSTGRRQAITWIKAGIFLIRNP